MRRSLVMLAGAGVPGVDAPAGEWVAFLTGRAAFFERLASAAATEDLAGQASEAARALRWQASHLIPATWPVVSQAVVLGVAA